MCTVALRDPMQQLTSATLRNSDLASAPSGVPTQLINDPRRIVMNLTAEQREQVATEVKRFAGDLNLTDDQKEKLQAALSEAREKVGQHLKNNPNTTKADIIAKVKAQRDEIRQRVVK